MKKPKKAVFINSIKLNNVTRENIKLVLKYVYDKKYFEILLKHSKTGSNFSCHSFCKARKEGLLILQKY